MSGLQDAVIETLVELGMTLPNIQAVLDLDDALAWSRETQQVDEFSSGLKSTSDDTSFLSSSEDAPISDLTEV
mgnify:CR=1 FL=1